MEEALSHLGPSCRVCPRLCKGVDRLANAFGVCRVGRYARVASAFPHFGEEDVLRGWRGSGTIFFSWCNLRCVFCLPPDAMIVTEKGIMSIREIFEVGEGERWWGEGQVRFLHGKLRVLTRSSRFAPVTKAFRHFFEGALVHIQPDGCPPLLLTPNHHVFAVHPSNPSEILRLRAGQLTEAHRLILPKRGVEGRLAIIGAADLFEGEPTFLHRPPDRVSGNVRAPEGVAVGLEVEERSGLPAPLQWTRALAWLLGVYCAAGWVSASGDRPHPDRIVFSFGLHEKDLACEVAALLRRQFGVRPRSVERGTALAVEVGEASLALWFEHLCGPDHPTKRVPGGIFSAPEEIQQAFLEGLRCGDGREGGSGSALITASPLLALGAFELGLRLGKVPSIEIWPPDPGEALAGETARPSLIYRVEFSEAGRERGGWEDGGAFYRIPIRRIERQAYKGWVYNLEVDDPDHSYVAAFVAVSNCQNFEISQLGEGEELTPKELARLMIRLQEMGCHNINFVTPEHVVPQIVEALPYAIEMGLRVPLVYNTSAYDGMESLRVMEGLVDIYMPDFKLWTSERSRRYLLASNYPEVARQTIAEMHRQVGELKVDEDGLAVRGLLVRHLVMPGLLDETREIVRWLAGLSVDTYVNLMDQYYPAWKAKTDPRYAEINRRVFRREMEEAFWMAREAGLWRFDTRWRMVIPGIEWALVE